MLFSVRKLTAATLLLLVPFMGWAQDDDLYFVPKKKAKTAKTEQTAKISNRYRDVEIIYADDDADISGISGSSRSVDEYNRRGGSSRGYRLPDDTLYVMTDSTVVTTRSMANDIYAQGYDEGYADGEDYAISRRMGRFTYGSIYASPWYYSYYDPFYYDYYDPWWGWGGYHVGYYGWHRPYWGYSWGYDPYWYGGWGYYGWHRPYYGGYYGHHGGRGYYWRGNNRRPGDTGRSGNYYRGGRSGGSVIGGRSSGVGRSGGQTSSRVAGRSAGGVNVRQGNSTYSGRSAGSNTSTGRSVMGNTSSSSRTYSGSSSSSTSRSGGYSSGGSTGRSSGGGFSSGGGGGRSGGGGGGGRSGGRGGR
ncbi:MAG: hypothetical protein IJT75_03285 [Bacteroidaceae bacterium]|nr:hypothetical protein [Bacteroidaceae bacterium]